MNEGVFVQRCLLDLERLSERFSSLGIGEDMASMSLSELWGLYAFLRRLAGASDESP